jgi:hypothetical protein
MTDNPFDKLLADLDADRASWEKEHFGDDKEALDAHYAYCLRVLAGGRIQAVFRPESI